MLFGSEVRFSGDTGYSESEGGKDPIEHIEEVVKILRQTLALPTTKDGRLLYPLNQRGVD